MGITPVITERPTDEDLVDTKEGIQARRVFDIVAASALDARNILALQKGIRRGAVYRNAYGEAPDSNVKCESVQVRARAPAPIGGTGLFEVVVTYQAASVASAQREPEIGGGSVWNIDWTLEKSPIDLDIDGYIIANTAEIPFDPPTQILRPRDVLVARWYVSGSDNLALFNTFAPYRTRVNEKSFKGVPRGSLLCLGVQIEEKRTDVHLLTARFEYAPPKTLPSNVICYGRDINDTHPTLWYRLTMPLEGWFDLKPNLSKLQITGAEYDLPAEKWSQILDKNGVPVSDSVVIDQYGQPLAEGATDTVVVAFRVYPYADFNEMGI